MHFAFSDQQVEFRDAVRQVLAKECTTDALRAAYDAPAARTPRWATLTELGVVGLTAPEDAGGLALGLVDLVPLLEEAGRVALPEPLLETTALALPLLADPAVTRGAAHEDAARWLGRLAEGDATAAVGSGDPGAPPVAGAVGCDVLVLLVGDGTASPEVHLVEADRITVEPVPSLDPTRRLGIPRWTPSPATLLASGPPAAALMAVTSDRAATATGAELVGLSERMIGMAADYAKERRQFGTPIGGFQAVKHLLAGAQVRLEFARPLVYAAAWSLDHGEPGASRSASTAKAYASDAATEAARVSLQVHGAIGYTWECDLQLFLKRAWALAAAWGSAADHRRLVLDSLVDGA